jgi:DNA-binding transcriptional regulator YiaG
MSEEIVPLISSSVAGPLGIRHLPRLWLKILLYAFGRLPEGYRHGIGGFDELLTGSLGIDNAAFVAYIENEKPGYLRLEVWVKEHARNLTPESVAALNHTILTREMSAEMAGERRERFGITDPTFAHGVSLNDLDDWDQAHRALTNSATTFPAR